MARSLPERTVDAWVAMTIQEHFPDALIWAPTQAAPNNWDYGLSLGDGKVLILEDKGTDPVLRVLQQPLNTHRVPIDSDQLDWYCDVVDPDVPAFYVLPAPPWIGAPTGSPVVPDQSIFRRQSANGPFGDWAWVIWCHDLRNYLGNRHSIDTDELAGIAQTISLNVFLNGVAACRYGRRVRGPGTGTSAALESATDEETVIEIVPEENSILDDRRRHGSALAVWVPAAALPGWAGQ